jgi:preprotein translocase subunit SecY
MRRSTFAPPPRRRRSPLPMLLLVLLLLVVGFVIYLSTVDTEVPTQRIEQDVTNEVLAG